MRITSGAFPCEACLDGTVGDDEQRRVLLANPLPAAQFQKILDARNAVAGCHPERFLKP